MAAKNVVWKKQNRGFDKVDVILNCIYISAMNLLCFFAAYCGLCTAKSGVDIGKRNIRNICIFIVIFSVVFSAAVISGFIKDKSVSGCVAAALSGAAGVLLLMRYRSLYKEDKGHISDPEVQALIFIAVILTVFCISFLVKRYVLMLLPPVLVIALTFTKGQSPDNRTLVMVVILGVIICVVKNETDRRYCMPEDREEASEKARRKLNAASGLVAALILLALSIVLSKEPDRLMKKYSRAVRDFQKSIESRFKGYAQNSDYKDEQTIDNKTPEYRELELLRITMDERPAGDMYLKDFSAVNYDGGVWNNDRNDFEGYVRAYGTEEEVREYIGGRIFRYFRNERSEMTTNITISYNSQGTSAVLPYFCDPYSFEEGSYRYLDSSFKPSDVTKYKLKGVRYNNVTANDVHNMNEAFYDLSDVERNNWMWYNDYVRERYLVVSSEFRDQTMMMISGKQYVNNTYRNLRHTEDLYRSYIPEYSDEMPEYDRESLNTVINEYRMILAEYTAAMLQGGYTYSLYPDSLNNGEDPVLYFLTTGKKGYCIHFASAGVMILRSLGVPARYVSGYKAEYDGFSEKADGSYEMPVLDSDGHAWVEIYLDNLGWIPVEMTPGDLNSRRTEDPSKTTEDTEVISGSETTENTIKDDDITVITSGTTEKGNTEAAGAGGSEDTSERKKPAGSKKKKDNHEDSLAVINTVFYIMIALGALYIVMLVPTAVRRLLVQRDINKDLRGKEGRDIILRLNQKLVRAAKKKKTSYRSLTDEQYRILLIRAYPQIITEAWDKYITVLQKLNYTDSAVIEKDEEELCRLIFRKTLLQKKERRRS